MYIRRHIEAVISRIVKRKPVVVLTGARQAGKSTMLRKIFTDTRYISLNRPMVRQSAMESPSLFFTENKPPLIVDGIQKAGGLFDYIKDIVDEDKTKGQFFLTGSQSLTLMKNVSDSLAGRAGIVKMLGLSQREIMGTEYRKPFLPTLEYRPALDYDTLVSRIHKGFFPELYEYPADLHDWSDFYSAYFQTYIEKDIRDVLNIRDESAFIKFVKAAASLTGQVLNMSTIAQLCGKDVKTVGAWLSALEHGGLVYLLPPYSNNYGKRLTKSPKLYFLDTGLACWLLGWNTPQQLTGGAAWGAIFETYVFAEILKSYYNDGITHPPLYFYRDSDRNEIDLVIADGETLYPIEIKTTGDPKKDAARAFRHVDNIPGKQRGMGAVICLAKNRLPLSDNVWILPGWGV